MFWAIISGMTSKGQKVNNTVALIVSCNCRIADEIQQLSPSDISFVENLLQIVQPFLHEFRLILKLKELKGFRPIAHV
ncbi:MAG: hypothetical protein MZV70_69960 [Desulfobacterales bacterium]|nr:hypothetical protein [Desulfobacterales bacterium]